MIHCIGDSHVGLFAGTDKGVAHWPSKKSSNILSWARAYRLGGCLAYKICEPETRTSGHRRLLQVLNEIPDKRVLLSFGEIDCRLHLLKQAKIQNRPIKDLVNECVKRYISLIVKVKDMGFETMVWNAPATHPDDYVPDKNNPSDGTCIERNAVTRKFNNALRKFLPGNIPFICVFDDLLLSDGTTNMYYYYDGTHLSQKVMPLVLKEFEHQGVLL